MSRRVDLDLGEATRWNSGVASILDAEHRGIVEEIWEDLERVGVKPSKSIQPHFSYQIGDYDTEGLLRALARVAKATGPFAVRTAGLGVFGGPQPVLHVVIVRSEQLSVFQRLLWGAIGSACRNAADFYWIDEWVPHVTLAAEELTRASIGRAAEALGSRTMRWTVPIDNLAFFEAGYGGHELKATFPLGD